VLDTGETRSKVTEVCRPGVSGAAAPSISDKQKTGAAYRNLIDVPRRPRMASA
jgi:hypothetical protein